MNDRLAMANVFFEPGERRAEKVHALFDRIARRYDLINDLQSLGLHRLWKRRLVRLARLSRGSRALDVCCGTGDVALRMARCGARVTGLDFSDDMLAVAARRFARWEREVRRAGGGLEWMRGDALKLPFPAESFDVITISYGLRNLADLEAGLREMLRVARPGGRVLVLDFGKPANALWRSVYFGYLRCAVPLLGRWVAGSAAAYAYILESLHHYPAQRGVAERMLRLGATCVATHELMGGAMAISYGERP